MSFVAIASSCSESRSRKSAAIIVHRIEQNRVSIGLAYSLSPKLKVTSKPGQLPRHKYTHTHTHLDWVTGDGGGDQDHQKRPVPPAPPQKAQSSARI